MSARWYVGVAIGPGINTYYAESSRAMATARAVMAGRILRWARLARR